MSAAPRRRRTGGLRALKSSRLGRAVLARLGAGYIALVRASVRWQVEGRDAFTAELAKGRGMVAAIWHGRLFLSPTWAPEGHETIAVISNNADGGLIAAIVGRFGVQAIRGSTYDKTKQRDKGGAEVTMAALSGLSRRAVVAITPDGPRGPRMRAQAGVARLAITSGAPVVPMAFSVRRGWLVRSWDRFLLPAPFTRGVEIYGRVLHPPTAAEVAADPALEAGFLAEIEAVLTEVTQRADALCGRPRLEPGPPLPALGAANPEPGEPEPGQETPSQAHPRAEA